ncbi:MAG: flagellar basal body rod protein FlgB [Sulfurimonadaceae bacterium]|nr:flagellar basal body rod protein FlgB [Sulfurimonadaceae bacterium]
MGIQVSRAHALMNAALDYRSTRQDMISSNIANADTPFYRPRDIRFEDHLHQKRQEIFADKSNQLEMARTDDSHLEPEASRSERRPVTFFRDGHGARNDGNSVDLDVETTEMAKNSVMFNALLAAKKKGGAIYRSVIDASAKV